MSDLSSFVSDIGSGVGDLFSGEGAAAQANDFTSASLLAQQNAQLAAASTRIQETQTARAVSQTLGTQQADVAGAGFTESGSALDLLKSSASQGALAKALVNIQGAINENSYAAQAGAYSGEAAAAKESENASTVGAIASIGGAIINGSGELASAGKTVASAYNSIFGSGAAADATTSTGLVDTTLMSSTDASLEGGAALSDSVAASDIGATIDTSSIALGTSAEAASTGIADASAGIAADLTGDIGADIGADVGADVASEAAAAATADAAASVGADAATAAAADAGGGSILGGIGDIIASATVLCTAFYDRRMISLETWKGAKAYGRMMSQDTFQGYLFWATPIAKRITSSWIFAWKMRGIFVPVVDEMAVITGWAPKNKSTFYGRSMIKILFVLSWTLGKVINLARRKNVTA